MLWGAEDQRLKRGFGFRLSASNRPKKIVSRLSLVSLVDYSRFLEWVAGRKKISFGRVETGGWRGAGENQADEEGTEHGRDFAEVGAAITNFRITDEICWQKPRKSVKCECCPQLQ